MIQVAQILFILSVLVILHEFGHYIAARIFKVRSEKFYLFMDLNFSIFSMKKINDKWQFKFLSANLPETKKIKENNEIVEIPIDLNTLPDDDWRKHKNSTEWGIGWLPMGGYVKLAGMIDESMDKEQLKQPVQPHEFRSKPAWQRLIIMLGGIIVNIVLAWLIYTIIFATIGKETISTQNFQANGLEFSQVGEIAGFKTGDKIVSVDGKMQENFNRLTIDILLGDQIKVLRDGKEVEFTLSDQAKKGILGEEGRLFMFPLLKKVEVGAIVPESAAEKIGLKINDQILAINHKAVPHFTFLRNELSKINKDSVLIKVLRNNQIVELNGITNEEGKLGFAPKGFSKEDFKKNYLKVEQMTLGKAIKAAVSESFVMFVYNIKQFKLLLRPKTEAYKQIKSPIGIARQLPNEWNWKFIWNYIAMFSIALAFMNLLPIPGLDGGHALFTIAEMITGKTLNEKTMGYVQTAGMIFLLTLMALVFGKDIYQWIASYF
ncbi:MAG: RIP metalloprotease RseP [Flavobacterium sp.]